MPTPTSPKTNATDVFSVEKRQAIMRAVKSRDTTPELIFRKALFAEGLRYRLHDKTLPGKPDLVLPKFKAVIFVHGCFWHGHDCPRGARVPKSNTEYWLDKIARNKARDKRNITALEDAGWRVRIVWECSVKNLETINDCITWLRSA